MFIGSALKDTIYISKLYTVHYFEFSKNYEFTGESHNFWEFVYIDKGEAIITADDKNILLKQGNVIFHKPNEWHNIKANGKIPPNIVIVSFECTSKDMAFFENKTLPVGHEQKILISKIISEYMNSFAEPLNDVYTNSLKRKENQLIGSEQLLRQYLCEFLLSFLRKHPTSIQKNLPSINYENSMLNLIINYMQSNISKNLTIENLTSYTGSNKTTITTIFKDKFQMGAIEYFHRMKIDMAKKYIREENYNISQIAELLGYSSIHYFSRQFKQITGMSPTKYSMSIKAIVAKL